MSKQFFKKYTNTMYLFLKMKNTSRKAFEFTHKHFITKKTPCVKFKVSMSLAFASGSFKMNKVYINK